VAKAELMVMPSNDEAENKNAADTARTVNMMAFFITSSPSQLFGCRLLLCAHDEFTFSVRRRA
jgi:hypothetical protein